MPGACPSSAKADNGMRMIGSETRRGATLPDSVSAFEALDPFERQVAISSMLGSVDARRRVRRPPG